MVTETTGQADRPFFTPAASSSPSWSEVLRGNSEKRCPSRMSWVCPEVTVSHAWDTFKRTCPAVHPSLSVWRSNCSSPLNLRQWNLQSFSDRQYPDLRLRSEWKSTLLWLVEEMNKSPTGVDYWYWHLWICHSSFHCNNYMQFYF